MYSCKSCEFARSSSTLQNVMLRRQCALHSYWTLLYFSFFRHFVFLPSLSVFFHLFLSCSSKVAMLCFIFFSLLHVIFLLLLDSDRRFWSQNILLTEKCGKRCSRQIGRVEHPHYRLISKKFSCFKWETESFPIITVSPSSKNKQRYGADNRQLFSKPGL
jgi:hypothetical protein